MSEANTGIEKETISFNPTHNQSQGKILEIKYTITDSTFKTQLPVFQEGTTDELLHFLYEFNQARSEIRAPSDWHGIIEQALNLLWGGAILCCDTWK